MNSNRITYLVLNCWNEEYSSTKMFILRCHMKIEHFIKWSPRRNYARAHVVGFDERHPSRADIPLVFEEPPSIPCRLYHSLTQPCAPLPLPLTTQGSSHSTCLHHFSPHLPSWVTVKNIFPVPPLGHNLSLQTNNQKRNNRPSLGH